MKRSLASLTLVFYLALLSLAQQPGPSPKENPNPSKDMAQQPARPVDDDVVRITTNLVQVDAVVTDKNGKPVTDLRPEEVEILEDGKPQRITHFFFVSLTPATNVAERVVKPDKNA